jgi:DNA gyrase subunit A
MQVAAGHELMLISSNGTLVRTPVTDISIVGRNTQGVRLIRLDEGDRLTGVERVESLGEEFDGAAEEGSAGSDAQDAGLSEPGPA